MPTTDDDLPEDYEALKAAFIEMRAKVFGAEALIEHLRLVIAKMKREIYGPRSERSQRLLDQLELQLEDMIAEATEAKAERANPVRGHLRRPTTRRNFPDHLPRRRIVHPAPTCCPCCGGDKLSGSARTSPRHSTWCRGNCSSPSMCARSSAAGPARRSASRRLRSTPSPGATRDRAYWR